MKRTNITVLKTTIKLLSPVFLLMFFSSIGTSQNLNAQDSIDKGTYLELIMHSTSLEDNFLGDSPDREVSVYLPPGYYSSPDKHYPVIYFLHSYALDHTGFFGGFWDGVDFTTICDDLIGSGEIDPMIVVSPNSYNKYGGSGYKNSFITGNWEDYIAQDVIHYIDRNFRTLRQMESRGLAGHSMGGTGTMWLVMNNPDICNAAYMLNGWFDLTEKYLVEFRDELIAASKADTYEGLHWLIQATIAEAATYAPDSLAQPFYAQFPLDNSGELIDSIWQKWLQHDLLTLLPSYKDSLLQLQAIQFDCGIDDYPSLVNGNINFSEALNDIGIEHTFEQYDGDHSNKLVERIKSKLLPFFSASLSDTMISGTISPQLIQWQGFAAKENFRLNETINLDTTVWNSDSVSYEIIAGDPEKLFSVDNMNRKIVTDTLKIDYEEKDYHNLLIKATYRNDQEILSDSANMFIRIENIYDNPSIIYDATFDIVENSRRNTIVDTIPFENIEKIPLSFKIIDGNINNTFMINLQGIIRILNNDSLDYEKYKQFILSVTMEELGGIYNIDTASIAINVENDPDDDNVNLQSRIISGFVVYPNPVEDIVHIRINDLGRWYFSITSPTGQLIFTDEMEGSTHQIDLSSFKKGVYIITVRSKDFVTTKKIIKL